MEDKKENKPCFVCYRNWNKYYTTNPVIIHTLKIRAKLLKAIHWLVSIMAFMFIPFIVLLCLNSRGKEGGWQTFPPSIPWLIAVASVIGLLALIAIILSEIYYSLDVYDVFEETEEFKIQQKKYQKEFERKEKLAKEQKAKDLVESYDILDDKNASKEERIEKIQKYIK